MKFAMLPALLALAAAATAPAQRLADPAGAFGARESISDISLSPDGTHVVYVAPGDGQASNVFAIDLRSSEGWPVLVSSGNPLAIRWCEFSGQRRIVCSLSGDVRDGSFVYSAQRLMALDLDGADPVRLGERASSYDYYGRFYDGYVIDWLPDEEGDVLMARVHVPEVNRSNTRIVDRGEGLGVDLIDTRTAAAQRVEAPRNEFNAFLSDRRGNVRISGSVLRRGATGMIDDTVVYHYRTPGDGEWRDLASYNFMTQAGFLPLEIDAELNAVYGLERYEGRLALFRVSLDGSLRKELVFAHDSVDVDNVVRIGRAGRIIGVTFAEDQRLTDFFDPEYRALAEGLAEALPQLPLIRFAAASDDENVLLLWAGSGSDPGRYFVYDRDSRQLNEIMLARPELEGARLANVRPVSYPAADDVRIPGYLTLPAGREDAGLPAIIMPHGGPGARDEWVFDWLAQYFAYQGYAVLQPNYRGSAGYGVEWFQRNGFQSWEIAISDINDGARWLVSEGIADPERLAIFGWSYGGYAALQSSVVAPTLYRAVVAVAPVTDLDLLRDMGRNYTSGANLRQFIGEGPHIREGSPAQNASRITVPVLMFHGDRDGNVDIRHSQLMRNRLQAAGGSVELIEYDDIDHYFADSFARAELLERSDAFLRGAMGLPELQTVERRRPASDPADPSQEPRRPVFPGAVVPDDAVGPGGDPDSDGS